MKGKLEFGSNKMSFDPDRYDDTVLGALFRSLIETQIDEIAGLVHDDKNVYSWEREIKFTLPETWEETCREVKSAADNVDDDLPEAEEI